jgi:hypothetical protein
MDQPWQSVFFISMRRQWLYFCYLLDASVVNSLTLSIPCCTCHSVFIDDFKVYGCSVLAADLWISRDIAFFTIPSVSYDSIFLSIWCVGREFIDAVDAMRKLSLSIRWWFEGQLLLCFGRWFMDQPWHSVFDNSMRRPWLYIFLSIWCVGREFIDVVDSIR